MAKKLTQHEAIIYFADKVAEAMELDEFRAEHTASVIQPEVVFDLISFDQVGQMTEATGDATASQVRRAAASLALLDMFVDGVRSENELTFDWASKHVTRTDQLNALIVQLGKQTVPPVATNSNTRKSLARATWSNAVVKPFVKHTPLTVDNSTFLSRFERLYDDMRDSSSGLAIVESNYMVSGVRGLKHFIGRIKENSLFAHECERADLMLDSLSRERSAKAFDDSLLDPLIPERFAVDTLERWRELARRPGLADQQTARESYIDGARTLKAVGALCATRSEGKSIDDFKKIIDESVKDPKKLTRLANSAIVKGVDGPSEYESNLREVELGTAGERIVAAALKFAGAEQFSADEQALLEAARQVIKSRLERYARGRSG